MPYLFMLVALAGMVTSELLLRKGMLIVGQFPQGLSGVWPFFLKVISNWYVLGAILAIAVGGIAWVMTVSRADALSRVYPVMALSYVLVVLFSIILFKENVSPVRWIGVALIVSGAFLVGRS